MKIRAKIAVASIAALAFLGGCGNSNETPAPDRTNILGQTHEVFDVTMDVAWQSMSTDEQSQMCIGWNGDYKDVLLDSFTKGAEANDRLTRLWARGWFDKTC